MSFYATLLLSVEEAKGSNSLLYLSLGGGGGGEIKNSSMGGNNLCLFTVVVHL